MERLAGERKPVDGIAFGREVCGELVSAERREWWLTNGLGGYAAGTVAGSLVRRYHGLLIAPVHPPLGRFLLAAKADATLVLSDRECPLSTNRWAGGSIEPEGYRAIESFQLEGRMPVWRYAVEGVRLEYRIWMEQGAHTTWLAWRLTADPGVTEEAELNLRILVNCRDHHGQTSAGSFQARTSAAGDGLKVRLPEEVTLHLQVTGGNLESQDYWVENFDLPLERERGLPDRDSHLCAAHARLKLHPGRWTGLVIGLEERGDVDLAAAMARFSERETALAKQAGQAAPELREAPSWVRQLVLAADSFIFARPLPEVSDGESVIAGYPWFGDWGRDTMIALPGLALATGRFESARRILETFARFVDGGMLPNDFPGTGTEVEYNSVDAALWYVEAWRAYQDATGDREAVGRAFPVLREILRDYRQGTRFGIHMDSGDALLMAGEPGVQLTWMDAKVGDWVVTPRGGKPVEINALWYNAHRILADLAELIDEDDAPWRTLADRIREGCRRFRRPGGGLFDLLDGPKGGDPTLRPNQIFAVSLPHSPLDPATQRQVFDLCRRHLWTSFGLRSLAPNHPDYRPRYQGGVYERDGGYHQGPVWGWLLGPYALAAHRVFGDAARAQALLEPVGSHLADAGLGTVSEIFDGAAPHTPRGCPAQAWSVACILEAWWRLERAKTGEAAH